jgi:hypothetical protein
MKRFWLLLAFAVLAAGCGGQKPGRLGLIGDRQVGYGWEFWREPSGKILYLRPKWPVLTANGGLISQCTETIRVSGLTAISFPGLEFAGQTEQPVTDTYGTPRALWETFGASLEQARQELAVTRPSAKPKWVEAFESCASRARAR